MYNHCVVEQQRRVSFKHHFSSRKEEGSDVFGTLKVKSIWCTLLCHFYWKWRINYLMCLNNFIFLLKERHERGWNVFALVNIMDHSMHTIESMELSIKNTTKYPTTKWLGGKDEWNSHWESSMFVIRCEVVQIFLGWGLEYHSICY